MSNLTSIPAFGFETATYNAEASYKEMQKPLMQNALAYAKSEVVKLDFEDAPDFTSNPEYQKVMEEQYNKAAKSAWKAANIEKAVGYIPLIGTLIGLSRIVRAARTSESLLRNKFSHIARGCVELLSLGFLLLIPDLILTAYRSHHARNVNLL